MCFRRESNSLFVFYSSAKSVVDQTILYIQVGGSWCSCSTSRIIFSEGVQRFYLIVIRLRICHLSLHWVHLQDLAWTTHPWDKYFPVYYLVKFVAPYLPNLDVLFVVSFRGLSRTSHCSDNFLIHPEMDILLTKNIILDYWVILMFWFMILLYPLKI